MALRRKSLEELHYWRQLREAGTALMGGVIMSLGDFLVVCIDKSVRIQHAPKDEANLVGGGLAFVVAVVGAMLAPDLSGP